MASDQLTGATGQRARSGLTTALVFWAFVMLVISALRFLVGGVGNLVAGPGRQERAWGLLLLGLAALCGYALWGWFKGRKRAWLSALVLLPVTALALVWDDQRTGDTTWAEWVGILLPPLAVWLLLWLPSMRRFFREP